MIFVTVGTHDQQFNRLIKVADEMVGLLKEQVVIQRGYSDYIPHRAEYFDWASMEKMEGWISQSRAIIAHAGAGTIVTVLKYGKPLVLTPRLKYYGEHLNDHQIELATALHQQSRVVMVVDLSCASVINAIKEAINQCHSPCQSSQLIKTLNQQLITWQLLDNK